MRYKYFYFLLTLVILSCCYYSHAQPGPGYRNDTLIIHFDYKRSEIRPEDSIAIDSRLEHYGKKQLLRIDLSGFCDSIGSDNYNLRLSRERIQAVVQSFRSKNMQETSIELKAYGRTRPLNDNRTAEARALNRRVVIVFRSKPADTPVQRTAAPPSPTLVEAFRDSASNSGRNIVLKHLNFYPGRHELLPVSLPILDTLVSILKDHPTMRIEIQGHVCCVVGDRDGIDADAGTYDLSVQRARYVFRYLVLHGIEEGRLTYKGYGAGHKLYPEEKNEIEKDGNRRVEIHVVSW
jgi:outer membrane protein OmpA-like peptidoglycan-associated protein